MQRPRLVVVGNGMVRNANGRGARCAGSRPVRHYRDRRRAAPELQPHTVETIAVGPRSVFSAWIAGSSPAMTSGETRFKSNATWSAESRPRQENHSSPEISAAIRGMEHRDKPNEGRRPSQQGHVNEHASDRDQKVQTHGARHFEGAGGVRAARLPLRARDRNRRRTRNHGCGPGAGVTDGCARSRWRRAPHRRGRRTYRAGTAADGPESRVVYPVQAALRITSRVPRKRCEITKEPR